MDAEPTFKTLDEFEREAPISLADFRREIAASKHAARETGAIRGGPPHDAPDEDLPLIGRLSQTARRALDEICFYEGIVTEGTTGHTLLVVGASALLEQEMVRLVASPAFEASKDLLAAAQKGSRPHVHSEIIQRIVSKRSPPTLGGVEVILYALRLGDRHDIGAIPGWLRSRYSSPYRDLLARGVFSRCLGSIRNAYRNPAVHGTGVFGEEDYEEFCRLVWAAPRASDWRAMGPDEDLGRFGVLHHHLNLLIDE